MSAAGLIREARNVLFERGWCQNALEDTDGRVCLLGALNVATCGSVRSNARFDNPHFLPAWEAMERPAGEVGEVGVVVFNNTRGRTFDEVIERLDKAEKLAEEREAVA